MPTQAYRAFKARLSSLRRHFVTTRVINNPLDSRSQDYLRAYRSLVHAEIESFLEGLAIGKARDALHLWDSQRKTSMSLLSIMAFSDVDHGKTPDKLAVFSSANDLAFRVKRAANTFIKGIESTNHGIKEANVLQMFIPIGIDPQQISQTLIIALSSYGRSRGEVAHSSFRVLQTIDPNSELSAVAQILADLAQLDAMVCQLR